MSFFESVVSKEEKQEILSDLQQIKIKLGILADGNKNDLTSSFLGLKNIIESYLTPEEKDITEIHNKINESLTYVKDAVEYVDAAKVEIDNDHKNVKTQTDHLKQLFEESSLNAKSIEEQNAQAKSLLTDIISSKNELSSVSTEIEKLSAEAESALLKLTNFDQAVVSVEDSKNKILLTQKNTRELLVEVKSLHTEVFGEEVKDEVTGETVVVEGLAAKLEVAYTKVDKSLIDLELRFDNFEKDKHAEYNQVKIDWEKEFTSLKYQIESLLPGALSAGLSQAYEEKKNYEIGEIKSANNIFYRAIIGLTCISVFPVILYITLLVLGHRTVEQVAYLAPNVFLAMLPIYIPCLWVAYSSDKKAKLSKRLSEEYAHKASISKTFEGISKQVSNISDNKMSEALESKLLFNLIQVSSENPGKLISDYDKSDHPLYDALDKGIAFSETLEKISFIPGISKIITSVQKRTQKRIEGLADGLDDVEALQEKA